MARPEGGDLIERVVFVGKSTKVVKGGRRFTFGAIVVVGDQNGKVGVGLGKAAEVIEAREKASKEARKSMVRIPLRDGRTLHHDSKARFCSAGVIMRAAPAGTGIIAGGVVRIVCELLGVKDVVAKSIGTTNPHNTIKAVMLALQGTHSPRYIAEKRNKKVGEVLGKGEQHQAATDIAAGEVA
ncbi:MAG: 30S ribosomal protein S5 [Proteobacteria bacterium]|nr:30S ribosomal protein S5 [Pseudomonadota bacterium]